MSRFAFHRQGQNSHGCTLARGGLPRLTLGLPHSAGLGHRPADLDVSLSTGRLNGLLLPGRGRKGMHPGRNPMTGSSGDRVGLAQPGPARRSGYGWGARRYAPARHPEPAW